MKSDGPWTQRWVVVCGGTSGLGLELVLAAAQQRANLVIVGRDSLRLQNAKTMALELGANSAMTFSVDLGIKEFGSISNQTTSQSNEADRLRAFLELNPVDLLLNAIGRSDRGSLEQVSDGELISMFNDNVICTWNMTRMALASMKRARGTIVNIGSLAGLVPAPGMGGYSIAKTALTAMTRQMRVELAGDGVHVMLVCPGPIARNDSGTRYGKLAEQRGLPEGASTAPGGGVKLKALDPKILCQKILEAAHRRKYELVTPVKASLLAGLNNLWPRLADWILTKYMRK